MEAKKEFIIVNTNYLSFEVILRGILKRDFKDDLRGRLRGIFGDLFQ